jgi:8-oxo-dGTP pyrophosphatase MutT (NUDIX family)
MVIKIYFNDKPLFLCDEVNAEVNRYAHHDDAVFIDEFSPPAVNSIIHEMRLEKVHAGIFLHKDLETLRKAFWRKFLLIQAAGGLVQNEKKELLFMLRRGKWDLPKGKLDRKETLEQCAVREVEEETGLRNITIGGPLLVTYHTYDENGKHFLKESHWYRMSVSGKQSLTPQLEEQITQLKWVEAKEVGSFTRNTYPSILDVLRAAGVTAFSK